MRTHDRHHASFRPSLFLILLCLLLGTLFIAGGASRADAVGQIVVRGITWALLIVAVMLGERPAFRPVRPAAFILLAAAVLVVAQTIPLPPTIWQALPGRAMLSDAMIGSDLGQPWRPLSTSPGATINAANSLIVPVTTLIFLAGLSEKDRRWLPGILLALVGASTLVGLMQFSGAGIDNPLINDSSGQVSGSFANRNHFALFVAFGCLLAPAWAFIDGRSPGWRVPVAMAMLLLFTLTILASGSRAGLLLGAIALVIGVILSQRGLRDALRRGPRWLRPALIGAAVITIAIFVLISFAADRAESINRAFLLDPGQDMRSRGLSTVIGAIRTYFPAGSGFGGFDPIFRMHEPFALLKMTYFNHAHNDFLEIVLDGGLPALLLLATAMGWWAIVSVRAWRPRKTHEGAADTMPRLGSAMLLLVFIASAFDYPARTPMMMALIVMAAVWLNGGSRTALPTPDQQL